MKTTYLWSSTNAALHPLIDSYTVGDDRLYDQKLLGFDIIATKAHCKMLEAVGLINEAEHQTLEATLCELFKLWEAGSFIVTKEFEDGHSAIEAYLTQQLGSVGKKVHTARSRNDQALVMMRLYLKDALNQVTARLSNVIDAFTMTTLRYKEVPMPGYTHTQKAMPTTVGLWLGSFADAFTDTQQGIKSVQAIIDQNPLGSAAGFGISLAIDREITTKCLGFNKTQQNPLYCGLSRGVFELMTLQALSPVMIYAGKFASDMLLFTTQEFNFFSLPPNMTTGSSIMPHKQNYDVFEIVRAKAHSFPCYAGQIESIVGSVGSGYHRDLQLTKRPTVDAFDTLLATLDSLALTSGALIVNKVNLRDAMTDDILSVDKINSLVLQGTPFREAYQQIKKSYVVNV